MSSEYQLEFYVDEEQKKEKDRKRRRQRQRMGFLPKRRKLKTPKQLSLLLSEDWPYFMRLMLIAGYKMVGDKKIRAVIEQVCPSDRSQPVDMNKLLDKKVGGLLDERLEPVVDLALRFDEGQKMEPELIARASQMLEQLRGHFPKKEEDLEGTPFGLDWEAVEKRAETLEKLLDNFKEAAKHGHVGAQLVPAAGAVPEELSDE